jgi:co-chaperonin GroES (HSP10)
MSKLGSLIEPMAGLIVVLVDTKDEITPQGLFVPQDIARGLHEGNRPTHGRIVAVAEDDDIDDDLKVGDHILFGKFTGTKITRTVIVEEADGHKRSRIDESVIVMHRKDVLARINNPDEAINLKIKS